MDNKYKCLQKNKYSIKDYSLVSIREQDIMQIREWRNEQIDILRQKRPITEKEQIQYFETNIWPTFELEKPPQILFSFLKNDILIGYGGLVHIDWDCKRAEISFLLETSLNKNKTDFLDKFRIYIDILSKIAFEELGFVKLTTETYEIRECVINFLEKYGFNKEGLLKRHILIDGKLKDSFLHAFYSEIYFQKKQEEFNILITSISKKVPLITKVKEASSNLNLNAKIFGGDINKNCIGRYFVDSFWEMDPIDSIKIDELINFCNKNKIKAIIPTRDGELSFFAKNKNFLIENCIFPMVSNANTIDICLDKMLFYETLKKFNFPAIETSKDINDLKCEYFVVKEQFGAGAKSLGLELSKRQAIDHAKKLKNPIFQPYIEGQEYSVDLYISKDRKFSAAISRKRDVVENGESQITTTHLNHKLENLCIEIALKLDIYAHAIFQVIIDKNGGFNIVECNPRFGGASTLSVTSGLNSFYWFLSEITGKGDLVFERSPFEFRQVRYPKDAVFLKIDESSYI